VEGDAGRNDFHHVALDHLACVLRILELLADGHPVTGLDELWEVGIECVIRKSR